MSALNDVLRFALEITGIAALAVWGWTAGGDGPFQLVLAVGAPLVLIIIWAFLIAPNSDSPLPATPRMLVGSGLLLVAAGALWVAGSREIAAVFALVNVINTVIFLVLPG